MKASELIQELTKQIEIYGDLPVNIFAYEANERVDPVEVNYFDDGEAIAITAGDWTKAVDPQHPAVKRELTDRARSGASPLLYEVVFEDGSVTNVAIPARLRRSEDELYDAIVFYELYDAIVFAVKAAGFDSDLIADWSDITEAIRLGTAAFGMGRTLWQGDAGPFDMERGKHELGED